MDKPDPSRRQHFVRLPGTFLSVLFAICTGSTALSAIALSHADALRIGNRVWQNECNGTVSGLTSWNEGENFASLGIGHFIWYPKDQRGPFEESFPELVRFVAAARARERSLYFPRILDPNGENTCPWASRSEFLNARNSPEMTELRNFLAASVDLQAEFLVHRLETALPKMLDEAAPADRANVQRQFARLAGTPQGCYALVDYVNFKGEGVLHTERYRGEGWGLLQVLEGMRGDGPGAASEFSRSAATVLKRRVQNSPPERKESRWLSGWLNRVNGYSRG